MSTFNLLLKNDTILKKNYIVVKSTFVKCKKPFDRNESQNS